MKKVRVWQVGWENEARVIEVEDDCECAPCEAIGRLPADADPIVMASLVEGTTKIEHRHMEPGPFGLGLMCRRATPEEIVAAEECAVLLQKGEIAEHRETDAERDASRKLHKTVGENFGLVAGGFLSMSGDPRVAGVGHGLMADAVARMGAELGRRAREKAGK